MMYHYSKIVYFANLSRSCFVPTFLNSTVAFAFSPLPSTANTLPIPKRMCSMV